MWAFTDKSCKGGMKSCMLELWYSRRRWQGLSATCNYALWSIIMHICLNWRSAGRSVRAVGREHDRPALAAGLCLQREDRGHLLGFVRWEPYFCKNKQWRFSFSFQNVRSCFSVVCSGQLCNWGGFLLENISQCSFISLSLNLFLLQERRETNITDFMLQLDSGFAALLSPWALLGQGEERVSGGYQFKHAWTSKEQKIWQLETGNELFSWVRLSMGSQCWWNKTRCRLSGVRNSSRGCSKLIQEEHRCLHHEFLCGDAYE